MPPRGGQLVTCDKACARCAVSSHAPARGATPSPRPRPPSDGCFKSCPREGGNCKRGGVVLCKLAFQVMPPRGGQRRRLQRQRSVVEVSSHAPARGATCRPEIAIMSTTFQVMPPRGGQLGLRRLASAQSSFKSCPREGGNCRHQCSLGIRLRFKSCPREGGNRFQQ